MALKRATFITYGKDDACVQTKEFIEGSGVVLDIRNLDEKPFSYDELSHLIGHLSLSHFVNANSPAYEKRKLDQEMPSRAELIKMMVEDHSLLRRPIIQTPRLITVGCDHQKISEMLQLSQNGDNQDDRQQQNSNAGNARSQGQNQQQQNRRERRRQQHSQSGNSR